MPVLQLPIAVSQPVNPVLATTFTSHGLEPRIIRELASLGLYYLVDATWPGELFWLSAASRKAVGDLLEKFGWPKIRRYHDSDEELDSRQMLGLHLPWIVLQQYSLHGPLRRELQNLARMNDEASIGAPTPLALALMPRMTMQEATHKLLDQLLERYGLHQQMPLDEVFGYQPTPALTNAQITQLTLDVMGMGLDMPTYDWVKNHTLEFVPQAFNALLAMLAVNDAPWQLRKWFNHHNLPAHPISSAELQRIIRRAHIRE